MSGSGGRTPGYFDPPSAKGRGIRSLNRTPIFILGGVVILVFTAIGYTLYQREASLHAKAAAGATPPAQGPADAAGILANAPNGIIPANLPHHSGPPAGPPASAPAASTAASTASPLSGYKQTSPGGLGGNGQLTAEQQLELQAAQQRFQEEENLAQSKMEAETTALASDSSVPLNTAAGQGGGTATGSNVAPGLPGISGAPNAGNGGGTQQADPNEQGEKNAFLNQGDNNPDLLTATRTAPLSPYEMRAGTVIPAVMVGGINSDLPGQIIGQVSENVYDTATGQYLLIPQGSKIVGTYDSRITTGQSRVLVVWDRIIYPDGDSLDIGGMSGADQGGYAGFTDEVNNHYLQIFGSALLTSLFSAGIQLSQPQPAANSNDVYSSQQVVAGAVGQQLGNAGIQIIERNLNIQPTLIIRPGYQFNVMVSKDIIVPPYVGGGSTGEITPASSSSVPPVTSP